MQRVDALPTVLLEHALAFVHHEELLAAELVCHAFHATILSRDVWQKRVRPLVVCWEDDAPTDVRGWKQLAHLLSKPHDVNARLLHDVIACSTVHRREETPTNTLQLSRCWTLLRSAPAHADPSQIFIFHGSVQRSIGDIAQIECGCFGGPACYWSSTPSEDKNAMDYIDYTVQSASLVQRLQIMPYRAFWHPHSPTYGPLAVSASFFRHANRQPDGKQYGELIYESPVFPLANEMALHECDLPTPVWLPKGAIFRLNLVGRHQAEPFELRGFVPDNDGDYYATVSYTNLVGVQATRRDYARDTCAPSC